MKERIFISYSHKDGGELAIRLLEDLTERGYYVWLDKERVKVGSSWSRDIEENLDLSEVVVAVLSAGSLESKVCRGEQLRSLQKNKCVIPVLAQSGADRPVYLEEKSCLDLSDTGMYSVRLEELISAIKNRSGAMLAPGFGRTRYDTVPPLPQNFVPRPAELEALRETVLSDQDHRHVALVALRGMGGIGKTVLAQALCRDSVVQAAFPDGVVWIKVGERPTDADLVHQMRETARAIGCSAEGFDTLERSSNLLRSLLSDKMALLVLNDVWDSTPVYQFQPSEDARFCRLLFTTRNDEISASVGARSQPLDILDNQQSRRLLASYAAMKDRELPQEAAGILNECHGLPLALAMIGALLRNKPRQRWADVLDSLRNANLDGIKLKFPNYPYPSLVAALETSVDNLEEYEKQLYLGFAVFPDHTAVPEATLEAVWKIDGKEVRRVNDKLVDRSLATRDDLGRMTLHDLQCDYVRKRVGTSPRELHSRLLKSYRHLCSGGWHTGPNDGYFFEHLAYHLTEAGRMTELRRVLFDYSWLEKKVEVSGVQGLIGDFDVALHEKARGPNFERGSEISLLLVQGALRLSAHVLGTDIRQFSSQLCGRLSPETNPAIAGLVRQARKSKSAGILPIKPTLITPGGSLWRTLASHSGYVNALAVTPDGELVIIALEDNVLEVWEMASGRKLYDLKGHSDSVAAVTVTPDGKLIVSASYDHTLKVWEVSSGRQLRTLEGHSNVVNAVVVTPNCNLALSASGDRTLKLWELDSGCCLRSFVGHSGPVYAVAVTPDMQLVVSASMDKTLRIWDVASASELHTMTGHTDWVRAVALTPDGKLAVSASHDQSLKVWEIASARELHTMTGHTDWVRAVAITPDGQLAISASEDQTVRIWDLIRGREIRSLIGHSDKVTSVTLTTRGDLAMSGSWDQTVKVWATGSAPELCGPVGHGGWVRSLAIMHGEKLAVSVSDDCKLKVWELESGRELRSLIGHSGSIYALAVTPDGKIAVSASRDDTIKIWDLADGRELRTLGGHSGPVAVLSATSNAMVVAASSRNLTVWDLASGSKLRTLTGHTGVVTAFATMPDGKQIISASDDQTLRVWDLASGRELRTLLSSGSVTALTVTPNGTLALFASNDHALKVWDLGQGGGLRILGSHKASITTVVASADGKKAFSGSADGWLKVWDLLTGREVRNMHNHPDKVLALSLTRDGQVLVSASDRMVKLWDVGSGRELGIFTADTPIACCSVSLAGDILVVGDRSGGVHFLSIETWTPDRGLLKIV